MDDFESEGPSDDYDELPLRASSCKLVYIFFLTRKSSFLSSFMDTLCCLRNKILYVLLWWTVYALTGVLFWCLFPSLLLISGNKQHRNSSPLKCIHYSNGLMKQVPFIHLREHTWWLIYTGDPLHSRAACTQPCNVNVHSRAHCSPGAQLCEQWGHGCVNNGAQLCASARLCKGSPVHTCISRYGSEAQIRNIPSLASEELIQC